MLGELHPFMICFPPAFPPQSTPKGSIPMWLLLKRWQKKLVWTLLFCYCLKDVSM